MERENISLIIDFDDTLVDVNDVSYTHLKLPTKA